MQHIMIVSSNLIKNENGAAFFALIIAMLLFATMGMATISIITNDLNTATSGNMNGSQSFYVADGGMQYTIMNEFSGDSDFSDNVSPTDPPLGVNSISMASGEFWVEYLNQSSSAVEIKITARVGTAIRVIQQTVNSVGYSFAAVMDGNLHMNNSAGTIAGNLGVNGTVTLDSNVLVTGNIYEGENIPVPTPDFSVYEGLTTSSYSGNRTFSSDFTGDLYVDGNVVLEANVTYNGILYATGNIDFNGDNITINGTLVSDMNIQGNNRSNIQLLSVALDANTQMPALITNGNTHFNNSNNITVTGTVWANGNIHANNSNDFDLTGTFITNGNIHIQNSSDTDLNFDVSYMQGLPGFSNLPVAPDAAGSVTLENWKSL